MKQQSKQRKIKQLIGFSMLCLFLSVLYSCRSQKTMMTEDLFLQFKRVNISHERNGASGGAILSEQIQYSQRKATADDYQTAVHHEEEQLDTNKTYTLDEVVVTSLVRFVPVRKGVVNLNFKVHVPKELVSENYQMILFPELLHNDSIVPLDWVVLKGSAFAAKQEQDYEKYNKYLSSIIDEEKYDSAFLDRKGVASDIRRHQKVYHEMYKKEWKKVMGYHKWRNKMEDRYAKYNAEKDGRRANLYHKLMREHNYEVVQDIAQRKDTFGLGYRYTDRFERRANAIPKYKLEREITLQSVPFKYRSIHVAGTKPYEIQRYTINIEDSLMITQHRYLFDKIAENDMRLKRKDDKFEELVPFPYVEEGVYLTDTLKPGNDYVFTYKHEYPVTSGLKTLRVTMNGIVDAVDRSGYTLPRADTLSFLIASLEELADTTLIWDRQVEDEEMADKTEVVEETAAQRSLKKKNAEILAYMRTVGMLDDGGKGDPNALGGVGGGYRKDYAEGIRLLQNREYLEAIKILDNYADYNTALCLTCLGYNQNAYMLLVQLEQNANVEYLSAIVAYRLFQKDKAAEHLLNACRLNPDKIYRTMRDPEIEQLIGEYQLMNQLKEIEATATY